MVLLFGIGASTRTQHNIRSEAVLALVSHCLGRIALFARIHACAKSLLGSLVDDDFLLRKGLFLLGRLSLVNLHFDLFLSLSRL